MCFTASVHNGAFIDINAALSVWCGLVTGVTGALVGSWHVHTLAIFTQVVTQLALIHIFTGRSIVAERVSGGTFTLITPFSVQAGSSTTQQGVSLTLINVHAVLHHHEAALVALETFTLKAARCVDTCTVTTQVRGDAALVNVCAVPLFCVQSEAAVAATLETADGVPARSMSTQALEHLTLIYIFVERPACQDFSPVGEAVPSGTDGSIIRCGWFGTLLTVNTPGSTH